MNPTGGGGGNGAIPEMSPTELKERLDRKDRLVVVDVREPFEKRIADLPDVGQLRIPLAELGDRLDELDADTETVLYCRSGSRSGWATQQLRSRGFDNVINLTGGVLAWRDDVDPSLQSY